MAGTAHADFYEKHTASLQIFEDFIPEKRFHAVRGYGADAVIQRHAYAFLAFAETKRAAKENPVGNAALLNEGFETAYHLSGTFEMTGGTDANCDFHCFTPSS